MNKIFITSDTHFNHANIIKYCNRPFDTVEEMNRTIIHNWNEVVSPDDTVYHLGDFIMGPERGLGEILYALNGHIHLVRGNHDTKGKLAYYAAHPDKITVHDVAHLPYKSLYFFMCHFPLESEEFYRMINKDNSEVIMVHGHVHNNEPFLNPSHRFNVSQDVTAFYPTPIDSIYEIVKRDFIEKGVWNE